MRYGVTVLCCVLIGYALLPANAAASHVQCGDVITQDATLDSDLVDCPGDGVVIGASGITLDLAGHTIDGAALDPDEPGNQGIENNGVDEVTVVNGRVQQFQAAVYIRAAGANEVRGLTLADSGIGVYAEDSSATVIEDNEVISSDAGVLLFHQGNFNQIRGNSVSGAGTGIFLVGFGSQVRLENTLVADNHVFDSGAGIYLAFPIDTLVTRNRVTRNAAEGIVDAGKFSRVDGNVVNGSGGAGILVSGGADSAVLIGNRTLDNGGDGVQVLEQVIESADDVTLTDNFSKGNADDGIDVDTPGATLARNRAINNGDFGIEAVPGVTDGGGNKAHANGNPAQCLNVSCK